MAIQSNNTPITNKVTTLTAIRAAEAAGYFTVGSKKYLGDQLVGKRNGQTYSFVLKDTGAAVNALEIGEDDDLSITEREVKLSLEPWHIAVETNAIETVTDMNIDSEIAEPNGQKLVQAAVKDAISKDLGKCGTAFVGSGFAPLSQASAHLASVTNEELYGFVDPNVEAILTSNGQMFVPVNAPDMYSKGLLGKFHGAEYRAQRFIPNVKISEALAEEFKSATVSSYADNGDGTASITLSGVSEKMPKGFVFWIDGVKATDLVGDATAQDKAWVVVEDSENGVAKVAAINMVNSNRDICDEDESDMTAGKFAGREVSSPEAGKYFGALLRANGVFEFETLNKLDAAGADYSTESVEGITLHCNKMVDLKKMLNITRFDMVTISGVIDQRGQAYILVK